MSKSLRVLALLAVSAVAGLATHQTVCAKERIWPPSGQDYLSIPRFGFESYFNGYGERASRA